MRRIARSPQNPVSTIRMLPKSIRFYRSRKSYDSYDTCVKHDPWLTMAPQTDLVKRLDGFERCYTYKWKYGNGDMHTRVYRWFDCRISLDTLVQPRDNKTLRGWSVSWSFANNPVEIEWLLLTNLKILTLFCLPKIIKSWSA